MELLSLILVLIQLKNSCRNIKFKTKATNTYIMDKLENVLRPKYSLFLLSTIDYRNLPLPKNMLLMMLIKIYYTDSPYKIEKKTEVNTTLPLKVDVKSVIY